ncbi:MAG TPA: hypothetical protein DHU69_06760, partial [Deltaproteobacteria bacterium]|nr:hypothetical protein [Deltaproteobacteria bacterium]
EPALGGLTKGDINEFPSLAKGLEPAPACIKQGGDLNMDFQVKKTNKKKERLFRYNANSIKFSLKNFKLLIFIFLIVVLFLLSTHKRNSSWTDPATLWKDVIKKGPKKARGYNNLGGFYYKQDKIDEAVQIYIIALKLEPNNALTHNNLGTIYHARRQIDRAINSYITALTVKPDYEKPYNNLGKVYAELGRIDEAITQFRIALKINPELIEAHNNLANVYATQGRLDEAISEYMAALRLTPDAPEIHYNLGTTYQTKGLKDKARKEYELALKLKPDFTLARQAIESLDRDFQGFRLR